tara:strand:+ start:5605 stop:5796 length:192 start_codon:yes stop_codon:yes gene_type:complete
MNCITKIVLEKTKYIKSHQELLKVFKEQKRNAKTGSEEKRLAIVIIKTEAKIEAVEEFTEIIL